MVDDLDIYRAARVLINQHGDEAPLHAAMRAEDLLDKGDLDGCAVWRCILRAIYELIAKDWTKRWVSCRIRRVPPC